MKEFYSAFLSLGQFAEVGQGNMNWPELLPAAEKAGAEYFLIEQDDTYGRDPIGLHPRLHREYLRVRIGYCIRPDATGPRCPAPPSRPAVPGIVLSCSFRVVASSRRHVVTSSRRPASWRLHLIAPPPHGVVGSSRRRPQAAGSR